MLCHRQELNSTSDILPSESPILISMYHLELTPESYKLYFLKFYLKFLTST